MEQADGYPASTIRINISPLGNKGESKKRQKFHRGTSLQYFPAPCLSLYSLLCLMDMECRAEEENSSHTQLSVRITLMLSMAFFFLYSCNFYSCWVNLLFGNVFCMNEHFASRE